jgi:predicted GIY-YIG superfamily endonuclease
MSSWSVYLLQSLDGKRTYIGASNDPDRRLRQHNREISGGAKSTGNHAWCRVALVTGFRDKIEALQFEWRWKHLTLSSPPGNPIDRRMDALHRLCILFPRANELIYSGDLLQTINFN